MAAVRLSLLLVLFLLLFTPSLCNRDAEILFGFKNSLSNVTGLGSWVPNSPPCDDGKNLWEHVTCEAGNVEGIILERMGLSGGVNIDSLIQLPGLRTLSFQHNNLTGPIPAFNRIGYLKNLFLSDNQFSGEIPDDYFADMMSLKKVHLANNQFTGKVPDSLASAPGLMELDIGYNQFSGPIPAVTSSKLGILDMSNNKLEGKIPEELSQFKATAFEGNEGLCGKPLDKVCKEDTGAQDKKKDNQQRPLTPPTDENPESKNDDGVSPVLPIALGVVAAAAIIALLVIVLVRKRKKEEDFRVLEKEDSHRVVEVHVSGSNRSSSAGSTKRSKSSRKGSGSVVAKKTMDELIMVNDDKGVFGLPDLMKAAAEVLGNGGMGSAYKAAMGTGLSVVVKRIREMNRLEKDSFEGEMRRMGSLRHPNILPLLGYHYRREEKLLVSQYVPNGSLMYCLHGDRGRCHAELNWHVRLKIIQGIAQGMNFIYTEFGNYELPHGNLKSSNVLLGKDYEPLLGDYAFYPLINQSYAANALFAYRAPEYIQYNQISPKADVYCLGIVILETLTGKFPSQYLSAGKGGTDIVEWVRSAIAENREAELLDPEIAKATNATNQMAELLRIGNSCTESNPNQRPDMQAVISRIEEITA